MLHVSGQIHIIDEPEFLGDWDRYNWCIHGILTAIIGAYGILTYNFLHKTQYIFFTYSDGVWIPGIRLCKGLLLPRAPLEFEKPPGPKPTKKTISGVMNPPHGNPFLKKYPLGN